MTALTEPRPPVLLLHVMKSEGKRWVVALNGRIAAGPHDDAVRAVQDARTIERSIRDKNPGAILHVYVPPEAEEAVAAARRGA